MKFQSNQPNLNYRGFHYLVPIGLCHSIVRNKKYGPFALYMALKVLSDGFVILGRESIQKITTELGISRRTYYRHLKWLLKRNWVGRSQKRIWIRGFDTVRIIEKIPAKLGVWISIKDIKNIKGWVCGSVINEVARADRIRAWKALAAETRGSAPIKADDLPALYPVSSALLANKFELSKRTAQKYKMLAHKSGYLELRKNLIPLKSQNKPIPMGELYTYLEGYPEHKGRVRIINKHLYLNSDDLIGIKMNFGKRRAIQRTPS